MSGTAKTLGVILPVIVASTFCLTVPLILILADVAILAAAIYAFASRHRETVRLPAQDLPELE